MGTEDSHTKWTLKLISVLYRTASFLIAYFNLVNEVPPKLANGDLLN